jgi:2-methylcitrate dehydratase PrpD
MTQAIVDYTEGFTFDKIPSDVLQEITRCLVDGFGVILSGVPAASSRIIQQYISESTTTGKSSVLGTSINTSSELAALANGVAGHAEDFDDTQLSTSPDRLYGLLTHPTTPVLAATLGVAQEIGASGKDFLTAMCAGFEVECKIAEAINPDHYVKGHHTTGTIGTFASVIAASKLWGLTSKEIRFAIGIAASKSAGIRANFGTMTKPYHAGAAAQNGIISAKLAKLGYEADPMALDGQWGYFQVKGGGSDSERLIGKLGNPYTIINPGVSVKPYPCGSLSHPSMDTLLDIILEQDIVPDEVAEVRLGAGHNILNPLRYQNPQNELEAKFSLQFCLGILIIRRRAGLQEFTDAVVQSEPVREMMKRIHTYHSPDIEAKGADKMRSSIEIRLKDGQTFQKEAFTSRGQPDRPMTKEELKGKFINCTQNTLSEEYMNKALEMIYQVQDLQNIGELVKLMVKN